MSPREQAEQQLSQALRLVLLSYRDDLKFDDYHILGKCNLILGGFVDEDGDFSDEYKELAIKAIEERNKPQILTELAEPEVSIILPNGISLR